MCYLQDINEGRTWKRRLEDHQNRFSNKQLNFTLWAPEISICGFRLQIGYFHSLNRALGEAICLCF
jgi:hypothetical protein